MIKPENKLNRSVVELIPENRSPNRVKKSPFLEKNNYNEIVNLSSLNDNNNTNNSPFDVQLVVMLGSLIALSLLGGWMSWKFYQPRLQKA